MRIAGSYRLHLTRLRQVGEAGERDPERAVEVCKVRGLGPAASRHALPWRLRRPDVSCIECKQQARQATNRVALLLTAPPPAAAAVELLV